VQLAFGVWVMGSQIPSCRRLKALLIGMLMSFKTGVWVGTGTKVLSSLSSKAAALISALLQKANKYDPYSVFGALPC